MVTAGEPEEKAAGTVKESVSHWEWVLPKGCSQVPTRWSFTNTEAAW